MIDKTLNSPAALADAGLIGPDDVRALERVADRYAVAVTPLLGDAIPQSAALRRQFIPDPSELETTPDERVDPIGDDLHSPTPGLVHRYPDRVLLKPVNVCPVYCRFCFRRETVGAAPAMTPAELEAAYAYVQARPQIFEAILTGGDPLMLKPKSLGRIADRLAAIPHLQVLRVHTRVPIAAPERIGAETLEALQSDGRLALYVSIHVNHADELTAPARDAIARLADAGIPLLGQTVLLRGVNDDAEILADLFRQLVTLRVRPYYLHHPDLAPGTSRFRLAIEEGQKIVAALRGRVSGLCLPTYVLDVPGGYGKSPIGPRYVEPEGDRLRVTDPFGRGHVYPPDIAEAYDGC